MDKSFLNGRQLYGDNFSTSELEKWYREEATAWADSGCIDSETIVYQYHEMNRRYGWKYTTGRTFKKAMSLGGAFAEEFEPIIDLVDEIYVIEPAEKFYRNVVHGKPAFYQAPSITGTLPFENETFDLITCFGVLHHIANVSYVFSELARVLEKGGLLLVREPIISMGDWTRERPALTKNERGIPLPVLQELIAKNKLAILGFKLIGFAPLLALGAKLKVDVWKNKFLLDMDASLSTLTRFNYRYHREKFFQKFGPTSAYIALTSASVH